MTQPNTLIFVDFPSPDAAAAARFYAAVFNWEVEGRPDNVFYRIVPGGFFPGPDGSDSEVGNLHMGIFDTKLAVPDPRTDTPQGPPGIAPRIYILVSDDDSEDAILGRAVANGAEVLWRGLHWGEFNGFHAAFRDPWGSEVILWSKAGDSPTIRAEQNAWELAKGLRKKEA